MGTASFPILASASDLVAHPQGAVFLDATLTLGPDVDDGATRYAKRHIAGARFFDLNRICDASNPLPRMLPSQAQLSDALAQLGVGPQQPVVVYDQDGLYSAPRAWWMLRCTEHPRVQVLDGGINAWLKAGGQVEIGEAPAFGSSSGSGGHDLAASHRVVDAAAVAKALQDPRAVVLDARSRARFAGEVAERNPSLKSGHMPGALNLPYTELITDAGTLVAKARFLEVLSALGLSPQEERLWISSCGSGVTACIFALAMEHYFSVPVRIYDGSWSEWGKGEVGEILTGSASPDASGPSTRR